MCIRDRRGSVYGFNFVYSGNFLSEVEQGQEEYTLSLIHI